MSDKWVIYCIRNRENGHTFGDRTCSCGSGLPRYDLNDARGIFCGYVCAKCEAEKAAHYRPEIFTDANYDADDLGEDE